MVRIGIDLDGQKFDYTRIWEMFKDIQVVTYGSPIGQLLIGKKVGETIVSEMNNSTRTLTVKSIQKAFDK